MNLTQNHPSAHHPWHRDHEDLVHEIHPLEGAAKTDRGRYHKQLTTRWAENRPRIITLWYNQSLLTIPVPCYRFWQRLTAPAAETTTPLAYPRHSLADKEH